MKVTYKKMTAKRASQIDWTKTTISKVQSLTKYKDSLKKELETLRLASQRRELTNEELDRLMELSKK